MSTSAPSGSQRFAVIGSNCFSAAWFVAHLLEQGHEVIGISRSAEPPDFMLPYKWKPHKRFRFVQADLNGDLDRVAGAIEEFRPPYVVNFAAQGMVAQSWQRPEHWFMTNTVAMVKLHDRLRKLDFLKRFLQASTPEVYGNTSGLVKETAPFNPSTPYAASKTACDMSLLSFKKAYGFPVVFTRSANVCGSAQALYRIIPKTVISILTGQKLKLDGGGTSVRSFIHIRDVAEATLAILLKGTPGEAYHLSTDKHHTIRQTVEEICRQMGASFEKSVEVGPARLGQDAAYLLDCTKARTELGWKPKLTVEDAIADTIAWLTRNLDAASKYPQDYIHKA